MEKIQNKEKKSTELSIYQLLSHITSWSYSKADLKKETIFSEKLMSQRFGVEAGEHNGTILEIRQ